MTTTAFVKLLESQNALSEIVPATGYISRYIEILNKPFHITHFNFV